MGTFNGIRANPKKPMSDKTRAYLEVNHATRTLKDLAIYLKVSPYKVQCWLSELSIVKKRACKSKRNPAENKAGFTEENTEVFFEHDRDLVTI